MTNPNSESEQLFERAQQYIKHGDLSAVRRLLDAGMSPNLANPDGFTLLILAAQEGNTAIGRLLLSKGADINRGTNHGAASLTPFSHAAANGRVAFVKLLLDHGANPSPDLEKWLPGFLRNSPQCVKILIDTREALRQRSSDSGWC